MRKTQPDHEGAGGDLRLLGDDPEAWHVDRQALALAQRGRLQEEDRARVLGVELEDGAQVGDDLVRLGVQVEDELLVRHDLLAELRRVGSAWLAVPR